jgi:hypothetical protein
MRTERPDSEPAPGTSFVRCTGLTVRLGPPRPETPEAFSGGAIVAADPSIWPEHELPAGEPDDAYSAALGALQSLVLAHAVAGVDVSSPAYEEGVETALDALANQHL